MVLQPFRVVTVATVVRSSALGSTATGGVLRSTVQITPGTATYSPISAISTGIVANPPRKAGILSVAYGIKINLFDYRLFVYL